MTQQLKSNVSVYLCTGLYCISFRYTARQTDSNALKIDITHKLKRSEMFSLFQLMIVFAIKE